MKPHTPGNGTAPIKGTKLPQVAIKKGAPSDVLEKSARLFNKRRDLSNRVYASNEARMNAKERAEKLNSKLGNGFPSFVKPMLQSHVTGGFWLGLPSHFCRKYLPKSDETITLVNENGDEWPTVYLAQKSGLSGGWRGFSLAHKLVDGDALVFELIKPKEFKVYIIRAYSLGAADGAMELLTSGSCLKRARPCELIRSGEETETKHQKTALTVALQPIKEEKSDSDSDEARSEVLEGIRLLEETIEFKDVKNMDTMMIAVDGLIIDCEFTKKARAKYYELCCSQNAFLHENLLEGLNIKLVAGAILGTVDIADAIKSSTLSASRDELEAWDKSLGALEKLGMNLAFLRARLQQLKWIVFLSEVHSKRYKEARRERAQLLEKMNSEKDKLVESEQALKLLDSEIKYLEGKARSHKLNFQLEVDSPW